MNRPISRRTGTVSLLAGAAAGVAQAAQSVTAVRHGRLAEPAVVLIHGAFADASNWSSVVERLR
ncbi:hypothetical protein [Streptomyces enissocaesilis]|uniref:Alpha/beta hydrolase n=1 Tax=Streptomyces enissocaesilis TaxID=332589 RepID=A0ABP6JEN3_9ACTN